MTWTIELHHQILRLLGKWLSKNSDVLVHYFEKRAKNLTLKGQHCALPILPFDADRATRELSKQKSAVACVGGVAGGGGRYRAGEGAEEKASKPAEVVAESIGADGTQEDQGHDYAVKPTQRATSKSSKFRFKIGCACFLLLLL